MNAAIEHFTQIPTAAGLRPQIVLGNESRKPIAWIPGGRTNGPYKLHAAIQAIPKARFIALTPGAFPNVTDHQYDQQPMIYFLGWDYDTENVEDGDEAAGILLGLPGCFGVRRSAGGHGVHVYCLFDRLVQVPDPRRWVRHATRLLGNEYSAFEAASRWLCKSDYRAFWFATTGPDVALPPRGFTWLREPEPRFDPSQLVRFIDLTGTDTTPSVSEETPIPDVPSRDLHADLLPLIEHLAPLVRSVGLHQVNIGVVKRLLEGTPWEFPTASACRIEHEHETNGYIEITANTVRIFSNPDGHDVLLVRSSNYWAGVLG